MVLQEIKLCYPTSYLLCSIGVLESTNGRCLTLMVPWEGNLLGGMGNFLRQLVNFPLDSQFRWKLKDRATLFSFCISSVYGSNDRTLKFLFLHDIWCIHSWCSSAPWDLMGDFNMTKLMVERQNCKVNIVDTDSINDLIQDLSVTPRLRNTY